MVMSHNLHTNLGNWCIFPENKLIYQGKWLKPQIVSGGEIIHLICANCFSNEQTNVFNIISFDCNSNKQIQSKFENNGGSGGTPRQPRHWVFPSRYSMKIS